MYFDIISIYPLSTVANPISITHMTLH